MDACTKCRKTADSLRPTPPTRGVPDRLCPSCFAAWAEFQLEAFTEEVHDLHAAHAPDDDEKGPDAWASCKWDACRRASRLANLRLLA